MVKSKMRKSEIAVKFAELVDLCKRNKQRFLPMKHERNGRLQEFGLYDYKTKRYTLGSIHAANAQKILHEMESMLKKG
jgi:hypothetical protein